MVKQLNNCEDGNSCRKQGGLILVEEFDVPDFIPYKVLLANPERIKKESHLDDNVSDDAIRASMIYIQDIIVEKVTGDCLMNQLKLIIHTCHVNDQYYIWYKRLLDEFIFPLLVYGVKADLSIEKTLQIRNQGIVRNNDTQHLQYPSINDVKFAEQRQNYKLDFYINRAVEFLRCNKQHFRELCCKSCACDCGVAPFQRAYHLPIVLADYPERCDPYKHPYTDYRWL